MFNGALKYIFLFNSELNNSHFLIFNHNFLKINQILTEDFNYTIKIEIIALWEFFYSFNF